MLALRALTVVNDNVLRWLAIGLGKRVVTTGGMALVLTIGTAGFVLPFVVLAWLAGWLADRFPKRSVIVWCKFAEIVVAAAAAGTVAWGAASGGTIAGLPAGLWLLLGTVIMIGCQAALMAPSVIGAIPETVPVPWLSRANGLFAMITLAATLVGMAAGNWLADGTPVPAADEMHSAPSWAHAAPAAACMVGIAIAGWIAAILLAHRPAADPSAPPPWNALTRTWEDLADLWADRHLLAAAAGIVFFWGLGAVAQLNVDQYATEAGAVGQRQIVPLLIALVSGIGLGSVVAGRLSSRGVNLGLVPAGGSIMAVASSFLALGPRTIFVDGSAAPWPMAHAVVSLVGLGFGAGMFDVPLEAFFQERSRPARRGALLAALNLLTFAGMFAASLLYGLLRSPRPGMTAPLLSSRTVFGIFAVLAAVAAVVATRAAPRASLRALVSAIVNLVYRFRVLDADFVPAAGPAVLVANHLSWLDGFLLPLACPRHVRMVVYGPNIRGRFLNSLADQWRFILFDPRPKSIGRALDAIRRGLADGDVIGIFCEGGISRTGQILGFKRGLEWLLDRVESPIVPVHIDGLWGSLLSFSEGRYFTKRLRGIRRPVTLLFGSPLPVGTHPDEARRALQELTAESVRRRFLASRLRPPRGIGAGEWAARLATAEAFDGCCLVRRDDTLVSSLAQGDPLHDSLGSHGHDLLGIASIAIDAATEPLALVESLRAARATLWLARIDQVGSIARLAAADSSLADRLRGTLQVIVMPIGSSADLPRANEAARACLESLGIEPVTAFAPPESGGLVAMNSPPSRATASHEITLKRDSVGRVVNGVVVWPRAIDRARLRRPPLEAAEPPPADERTLVIGATLPTDGAAARAAVLREAFDIDGEGFLVPRSD
ncbi:MAG: MFS transporter [Planctomycetia bacterium]